MRQGALAAAVVFGVVAFSSTGCVKHDEPQAPAAAATGAKVTETRTAAEVVPVPVVLPASFDALYPPRAQGSLWVAAMHEMERPLQGVIVDLQEKDMPGVQANLAKFEAAYTRASKLVPEWEASFAAAPVAGLKAALASGDPGKVMPAVAALGQTCHGCHVIRMPEARLRHHWQSLAKIEVVDPLSKEKLPWGAFKQRMAANLTGVGINLEQGQRDHARTQLKAFQARFGALRGSCQGCHDTERHYFVDKHVHATVAQLEGALAAPTIEPARVAKLSQEIGKKSCDGCHNVHVPGSMTRHP